MTQIWEVLSNVCVLACACVCAHVKYSYKRLGKFGSVSMLVVAVHQKQNQKRAMWHLQNKLLLPTLYMPLRTTQVLDVASALVLIQPNTVSHRCVSRQNQSEIVLYSALDESFPITPGKQQDMSQLHHTDSKWT